MSAEKKLYNLEVNPPEEVWQKLLSALDELQSENIFKKKLSSIQANPPAGIWGKIESSLENESHDEAVAAKLLNLTEAPPAGTWNNITTQLAEEEFNKKFAALGELEVAPPANSWVAISTELDGEARVIPIRKTGRRFLRYAAAAVIIGLLAWGGISLMNNSNTSEQSLAIEEAKPIPAISTPVQSNNESTAGKSETTEVPVVKGTTEKEFIAADNKIKIKRTASTSFAKLNTSTDASESNHTGSEEIVADINALQKNKTGELASATTPDAPRYLVYLNDEGELVKVSKKLADMKCLYNKNGEVSQDALASINRQVCDDLVKSWQEKLSKAPINLSFNPLEMADILK